MEAVPQGTNRNRLLLLVASTLSIGLTVLLLFWPRAGIPPESSVLAVSGSTVESPELHVAPRPWLVPLTGVDFQPVSADFTLPDPFECLQPGRIQAWRMEVLLTGPDGVPSRAFGNFQIRPRARDYVNPRFIDSSSGFSSDEYGTGLGAFPNRVLTSANLVRDKTEIIVIVGQRPYPARVINLNQEDNIAVLEVTGTLFPRIPVINEPLYGPIPEVAGNCWMWREPSGELKVADQFTNPPVHDLENGVVSFRYRNAIHGFSTTAGDVWNVVDLRKLNHSMTGIGIDGMEDIPKGEPARIEELAPKFGSQVVQVKATGRVHPVRPWIVDCEAGIRQPDAPEPTWYGYPDQFWTAGNWFGDFVLMPGSKTGTGKVRSYQLPYCLGQVHDLAVLPMPEAGTTRWTLERRFRISPENSRIDQEFRHHSEWESLPPWMVGMMNESFQVTGCTRQLARIEREFRLELKMDESDESASRKVQMPFAKTDPALPLALTGTQVCFVDRTNGLVVQSVLKGKFERVLKDRGSVSTEISMIVQRLEPDLLAEVPGRWRDSTDTKPSLTLADIDRDRLSAGLQSNDQRYPLIAEALALLQLVHPQPDPELSGILSGGNARFFRSPARGEVARKWILPADVPRFVAQISRDGMSTSWTQDALDLLEHNDRFDPDPWLLNTFSAAASDSTISTQFRALRLIEGTYRNQADVLVMAVLNQLPNKTIWARTLFLELLEEHGTNACLAKLESLQQRLNESDSMFSLRIRQAIATIKSRVESASSH